MAGENQELVRQAAPKDVRALLKSDQLKNAVAAALPKHLKPERFIRIALNAVMRQPDLLSCTQESLFRALLDLSSYGLEPDGRRAHLIPFKDNKNCVCGHAMDIHRGQDCTGVGCTCKARQSRTDVQLIIDYKGLAELVRRSGDVSYIHADVVYDTDTFDFSYGSDAHLKHIPNLESPGKKLIAGYSFVKLKDGSEDFIVLSPAELEKIRKSSKIPNGPAWSNWPDEMNKKSCFRRHSKWLPLSPEIHDIITADEQSDINQDAAMDLASSDVMRVAIPIESLTPSDNPNRGHDESMQSNAKVASQTDAPATSAAPIKGATAEDPTANMSEDELKQYNLKLDQEIVQQESAREQKKTTPRTKKEEKGWS